MTNALVSIIIPVRDRAEMLRRCLECLKKQTYPNIEIIIVDGNSTDNTCDIARQYTDKVFIFSQKGDHRCAQRNLGVQKASGKYVLIIDSDMELGSEVVRSCVEKMEGNTEISGLVIPEESFGKGFWAQCKKLEKSFYLGVSWMEAARFFRRETFTKVGGYATELISGEDWDLSQRIAKEGKIARVHEFIFHNEGKVVFYKTVKKKFYYAQKFAKYVAKNRNSKEVKKQVGIVARFHLFLSQPKKLFRRPILGLGLLFMKICEFGFGGAGFLIGKIKK